MSTDKGKNDLMEEIPEMESTPRLRRRLQRIKTSNPEKIWETGTLGDHFSDIVADTVGSWLFIIVQSIFFALWIWANVSYYQNPWDPYPFILLNLVLSFQAAFTAPIIMMSQNRQGDIDRLNAANSYKINMKAMLEIELLQNKIDEIQKEDITALTKELKAIKSELRKISTSKPE